MSPIRPENRGRYPTDWRTISDAIRTRAGGRCECRGECATRGAKSTACAAPDATGRCSSLNGQPNPRTGSRVVLTVAHLDDTPENCHPGNLRAMCQACHLAYDHRLHQRNRLTSARGDVLPMFEEPR